MDGNTTNMASMSYYLIVCYIIGAVIRWFRHYSVTNSLLLVTMRCGFYSFTSLSGNVHSSHTRASVIKQYSLVLVKAH